MSGNLVGRHRNKSERPPSRRTSLSRAGSMFRRAACLAAAATLFPAAWGFAFEGIIVLPGGAPAAGAEVSILGLSGIQRTDAAGRFEWKPAPAPPFEVLIVLPGGRYTRPVRVETIPESGPVKIEVGPVISESVTVTGAATTIENAPAAGTALVPRADLEMRQPAHLMQALENVAGVSQVSEGQAAVPAVRGLARGRTLFLLDGARVSSERRVGPSATFLDPFALDAVEVSRGPGSVAYGSDAFGGVISARTRSFEPGGPLRFRATGTASVGTPGGRAGAEVSGGFGPEGGFLVLGHYREYEDWKSPKGDVFNSGWRDSGLLVRAGHRSGPASSRPVGTATTAATSSAPETTRRPSASSTPPRTRAASPLLRRRSLRRLHAHGDQRVPGLVLAGHGPGSVRVNATRPSSGRTCRRATSRFERSPSGMWVRPASRSGSM